MLVVDDILIAQFVLPFARGLGEGTLSGVYKWLEDQGVELGHRLLGRLTGSRLGTADVEHLVGDLGTYVQRHPGAAARLTAAALAEAGKRAETDEEVLEVFRSFLMAVFELAESLGKPAVVPGFLTGTEHLAVIDVRTTNASQKFGTPAIHSPQDGDPRITLARQGGPLFGQEDSPLPRIWLVTATQDACNELQQRARESTRYVKRPGLDDFEQSMKGQLLVTDITPRQVLVKEPAITPVGIFVPRGDDNRPLNWAETPDGVIAMHDALVAAVGEMVAERTMWVRSWTEALNRRPHRA